MTCDAVGLEERRSGLAPRRGDAVFEPSWSRLATPPKGSPYAPLEGSRPRVLAPPGVIDNVRPVTYYKQNQYVIRIQSYLGQKSS